jgi:hypothetical protein
MEEILMRLGLSEIAARDFTNNWINSFERLLILTVDGLERLIKQIHTEITKERDCSSRSSLKSWVTLSIFGWTICILGILYELNQVPEKLATTWNLVRKTEQEATKTVSSLDMIKQPEAYMKETKWSQWKESMITYLHSKNGHTNLLLSYIIWEINEPYYTQGVQHDQIGRICPFSMVLSIIETMGWHMTYSGFLH